MTHLIDKDAIVAEIKERINRDNENAASYSDGSEHDYLCRVKEAVYKDLLSFLDTLEVKENDLMEEIDYEDYARFFKEHPDYNDGSWGFEETWTFAQYCYKLGLKAQKGE